MQCVKGVKLAAASPGLLQKLGRVIKEKAGEDFQRVFQGASKTREKLGVSRDAITPVMMCLCISQEF